MRVHVRRFALLAALIAPLVAAAQDATAPGPGACPGCGQARAAGGRGARIFDPSTVTTLTGQITDIRRVERGRRGHAGVHLTLAAGAETVNVVLGPDFYVDGQALKLAKGDTVEVKGSRVTFGDKAAVVAQEVRRGGDVLALRDANGAPLWRGQRGGRR